MPTSPLFDESPAAVCRGLVYLATKEIYGESLPYAENECETLAEDLSAAHAYLSDGARKITLPLRSLLRFAYAPYDGKTVPRLFRYTALFSADDSTTLAPKPLFLFLLSFWRHALLSSLSPTVSVGATADTCTFSCLIPKEDAATLRALQRPTEENSFPLCMEEADRFYRLTVSYPLYPFV